MTDRLAPCVVLTIEFWSGINFVNNWTTIVIWAAVVAAVFGYLWWQGQIQRLAVYVQETREELKKCSWPSWIELRGSTLLIIVAVGLLGLFIVIVDFILFRSTFYPLVQAVAILAVIVFLAAKSKRQ